MSPKRVAQLMRQAGIQGVSRRERVCTMQRDERAPPAPDLVERHFSVEAPDQLYVADITYSPTWTGFVYLAVTLDAYTRSVAGR